MHFVVKKKLEICANAGEFGSLYKSIFKAGLATFGLALTPNISLVIINLILQGVSDGSQPLMSKYYSEKRTNDLTEAKHMAYTFAIIYLPYYSDKLYDKILLVAGCSGVSKSSAENDWLSDKNTNFTFFAYLK